MEVQSGARGLGGYPDGQLDPRRFVDGRDGTMLTRMLEALRPDVWSWLLGFVFRYCLLARLAGLVWAGVACEYGAIAALRCSLHTLRGRQVLYPKHGGRPSLVHARINRVNMNIGLEDSREDTSNLQECGYPSLV